MRLSRKIFLILLGMVLTISVAAYFYNYINTLNEKSKNFTTALNTLKNENTKLHYNILATSIYAYNNEDLIANSVKKFKQQYQILKNEDILKMDHYMKHLQDPINRLDTSINKQVNKITYFLILNANIKNSFVFLLDYALKNKTYFAKNNSVKQQINLIIDKLSNARRTQDNDYFKSIKLLSVKEPLNAAQKQYIKTFNLHVAYIINHFTLFTNSIDSILNSPIDKQTDEIYTSFNKITMDDKRVLYYVTLFIFFSTITGASIIIILMLKIERENKILRQTKENLDYERLHDNLTNLYNRTALEDILKQDNKHTLVLMNIDKFKHINDFYGNSIGNLLLIELSKLITSQNLSSYNPRYFRIGGDEFALLLENIGHDEVFSVARQLLSLISSHHFNIQKINILLSVSIAISNKAPLLENADMALKHIKTDYKKSLIMFDPNLNLVGKIQENIETIQLVDDAIKHDRVVAYFQPILNLTTNKVEKYEALVRIIKPDGSILPPLEFLPIIEDTTLYYKITKIMILETLKMAHAHPAYRFSINLLMQDITNNKLMDMLFEKLEHRETNNLNIDIELLETQHLHDVNKIEQFIQRAHKHGCYILVDDFGTGYSNFAYFSQLDIDILKIDASITCKIIKSEKALQTMQTIKYFASVIGVKTVAEFVDNKEVFEKLQEIGIDYAQGYLIGKPQADLLSDDHF
jgi:diguanylate cyclase (GGDEF)-like protein